MAINAYSWAKDGEKNLSPSFKVREFRCSDNTDPIFIDSELEIGRASCRERV